MKTAKSTQIIIILILFSFVMAKAQQAPIPYHKEPYFLNSGIYNGLSEAAEYFSASRQVIQIGDAPWLRLYFGNWNLGNASYILLTSVKDKAQQRLDSIALQYWKNSSAFFNGDAVEIELYIAPEDKGIFFEIREVMVGEPASAGEESALCGICGGDDRVASNDPAVGRLSPAGCTGWIISNGAYLTAGHCAPFNSNEVLEFNVPPSNPDGTINHPSPENQYPVDQVIDGEDGGVGDDWAVFTCNPNNSTNLLPVHGQGAFYRMSKDISGTQSGIRVTGYGVDDDPPGSTGGYNSDSQTQQTDSKSGFSEFGTAIYHTVDMTYGNSGSPLISTQYNTVTVGINTHCFEPCFLTSNKGTSFSNGNLESAIQTFPGANVVYADNGHPINLENGSVLRPYDTVNEAVNAASTGGMVSIVRGSYNENITITKALTLSAPVGTVTIGTMPFDTPELKAASNSNIKNVNE